VLQTRTDSDITQSNQDLARYRVLQTRTDSDIT
jgi:hypothetical protein